MKTPSYIRKFFVISALCAMAVFGLIAATCENGQRGDVTAESFPARGGHGAVDYNGKIYVVGGVDKFGFFNDVWSSPDGATWTQETGSAGFPARAGHVSLIFNNRMWIIGGAGGDISRPELFNDVWSSDNGKNWSQATGSAPFSKRAFAAGAVFNDGSGEKMYLIGGYDGASGLNDVWASSDGVTWVEQTGTPFTPARAGHTALVFQNKLWVIGGASGPSVNIQTMQVSGAFLNDVWSSVDGKNWTQETQAGGTSSFPVRAGHVSVVHNGNMWVLGGYGGSDGKSYLNTVWASKDGKTWFPVTIRAEFSGRAGHAGLSREGKIWIMGGYDGGRFLDDTWTSDTGQKWYQVGGKGQLPSREGLATAEFDGKLWVVGGFSLEFDDPANPSNGKYKTQYFKDVWQSIDGAQWSRVTDKPAFGERQYPALLSYAGKLWLIGGTFSAPGTLSYYNDVWSSADGETWTRVLADNSAANAGSTTQFSQRAQHGAVVYNNKMWVIGGYGPVGAAGGGEALNDVWSSSDGVTWTRALASTDTPGTSQFTKRTWHRVVAYNAGSGEKMYLIGGNGQTALNDVWWSTDGRTWSQVTATTPFTPGRGLHSAVVFNGRIFVIGGLNGSTDYNDVWSSSDGVVWNQLTADGTAPFEKRSAFGAAAFNGRIRIFAGSTKRVGTYSYYLGDVWSSSNGLRQDWTSP